jgi:hypothetical protein
MRLRLLLQPAWLRFVVIALLSVVTTGALITLESRDEIESNVLSAIILGVVTAGLFAATTQDTHRGALEALSGLDDARRSEAIAAVSRGIVPADPDVRAAAIRLGRVSLGNRSPEQLKRTEIWAWITFGLLFVFAVAAAVNFPSDRVFYAVVAVVCAIVIPASVRTSRRLQRNIALLSGG